MKPGATAMNFNEIIKLCTFFLFINVNQAYCHKQGDAFLCKLKKRKLEFVEFIPDQILKTIGFFRSDALEICRDHDDLSVDDREKRVESVFFRRVRNVSCSYRTMFSQAYQGESCTSHERKF